MLPLHEVLSRQLHFVCGKGGVGKSVVACALARAFRRRGLSVLLVQVNAPDSHARLLGAPPISSQLVEIEPGLSAVNITPAAAMKEYALLTLRFEALYRTVFENRLTKVFLRFMPSLSELTIQGKIWHHAEQRSPSTVDDRPRFDRIVVDCPSTGHGLKLMRVARIVHDASRVGPMAEKTRAMAAVVEDPARTALHVVALPEELPVNEARDLVAQVRSARVAPLGAAFLNQRLPRLFDDAADNALARAAPAAAGDERLRALFDVAERRRGREKLEKEQRARLDALELPVVELPVSWSGPLGPAEVDRFAAIVDAEMGAKA